MKKYLLSVLALSVIGLYPSNEASAQEKTEKQKNKIGEYDEIIIKQKDADKDGKVTVEIKDGLVTINGKPLDEFDDDNISVRRRSATRIALAGSASPFRNGTNVWSFDNEDRPLLGVTTEQAEGGAKILSISENSAAEKAGLKKGDVIISVNEAKTTTPEELTKVIGKHKPEDKVTVKYKREGKEEKLTATLGKREPMIFGGENFTMPRVPDMEHFNFEFDGNGPGTRIFAPAMRPRLGIRAQDTEDGKGVKVLSVDKESAAEKAGIKANDIITEFDGKPVNSADDLVDASRDAREKSTMSLKLSRDGKNQSVELKIPKKLKTANL